MKGLSRNQLHQVKEAFDLASFCKKWWKSICKELKQSGVSQVQKMQVLCKLSNGLIKEALIYAETQEDMDSVCSSVLDTYKEITHGEE